MYEIKAFPRGEEAPGGGVCIIMVTSRCCRTSLVAQTVKRLPAMRETRVRSLSREDPLEKEMQPTPVLLPAESHGWRSLVGYSPWGHKELDTTEWLHFTSLLLLVVWQKVTQHYKVIILQLKKNLPIICKDFKASVSFICLFPAMLQIFSKAKCSIL